ncbi:Eco57I restriction-modification methylase domain-containing protein [Quadrisphaera granulorum]|uniref:Eco57I restriction-modification methylase domain-containing protein n=1 Tax=Quadrisphaera granulorum TaxID=317664 RepID=UPI001B8672EF|nr:Eco57I restriction-modification methylase domain-containing protein [Quadrisphaera granulorum]
MAEAIEHGEIFTRRWVVDLILDLCGYTSDRDLADLRAVEPACGAGAFLGPMVERLSASLRAHDRAIGDAAEALRAYDLLDHNVVAARRLATTTLTQQGWDAEESARIAEKWVGQGDYLLRERDVDLDLVVGNPPYIRLEDVGEERSAEYRAACSTMSGRADIYVGFIEVGLRSLKPGGVLGFIVADRWMRNAYGARLREFVAAGYAVDVTVQMHDVDAFEEQVAAYPAISVLRRGEQRSPIAADTTRTFGEPAARQLVEWSRTADAEPLTTPALQVDRLPTWFSGSDLWPTGSPIALGMIEHLNANFRPLEDPETATRVSIGIATGADKVYVTKDPRVIEGPDAIEHERLLPLAMAADTNSGTMTWSGHYLVNPWDEEGLVELEAWPRFASYMRSHGEALLRRRVAGRNSDRWWRTIDRVTAGLIDRPKLLFPDMRMTSRPVYEPGGLYPHHNVYYVVSDGWDLRVLGGLLYSKIAEQTVSAYCVKMRGGTLRFQAQYLRRVRVPRPEQIDADTAAALANAFDRRDSAAATEAALRVYGLDERTADWLRSL